MRNRLKIFTLFLLVINAISAIINPVYILLRYGYGYATSYFGGGLLAIFFAVLIFFDIKLLIDNKDSEKVYNMVIYSIVLIILNALGVFISVGFWVSLIFAVLIIINAYKLRKFRK